MFTGVSAAIPGGTRLAPSSLEETETSYAPKPDTMPILSEQPSLYVQGFHEVTRLEGYARRFAYNSGGANALENSGDSRRSSSGVRKMLRGEE